MNTLGYQARRETMWLSETTDFRAVVKTSTPVPAGSVAQIVLGNGTAWLGTLNAARNAFTWQVEATETTAAKVPAGTTYKLVVTMPRSVGGGNDDVMPLFGSVVRQD